MSTFATNHVQSLLTSSSSQNVAVEDDSPENEELLSLLLDLRSPLDGDAVKSTLDALARNGSSRIASTESNGDVSPLRQTLLAKVLVGLYVQSLDVCLKEASEADTEAEWWSNIERSRQLVIWYSFASEDYTYRSMPFILQLCTYSSTHSAQTLCRNNSAGLTGTKHPITTVILYT